MVSSRYRRCSFSHLAAVLEVLWADVDEEVDLVVVHAMPQPIHEHGGLRVSGLERVPDSRRLDQLGALVPVFYLAVRPVIEPLMEQEQNQESGVYAR